MTTAPEFDLDVELARLMENVHSLLSALASMLLDLLLVWGGCAADSHSGRPSSGSRWAIRS